MEFKKLYRMSGEAQPTVVLLNDEGEEYPVFLESLHNTILFPEVLKSGYKLAGLPYDFVKDGASLMDLPMEDFPSENDLQVMQQMYDMLGTKMPITEISKHIDAAIARGIPMPPTDYKITTRDAFLKYLRNYEALPIESDFMPINYFVAPAARFTVQEFHNPENSDYIRILISRRRMSIKKFHSLVRWLEDKGMPKNASFGDVVDYYFAWGVDGLNEMFVSKKPMQSTVNLVPGSSNFKIDPRVTNAITENPYTAYNYTYGLVNSSGRWELSEEDKQYHWRTTESNPKKYDEFCQSIPIGNSVRIKLKAPVTRKIFELQGNDCFVKYGTDTFMIMTAGPNNTPVYHTYPTIVIPSLTDISTTLPGAYALPRNKELLNEHCMIEALAKYIYEIRKDPRQVSSYEALLASGASPEDAVLYILTYAGFITDSLDTFVEDQEIGEESNMVKMPPTVVYDYMAGKRVPEGEENTSLGEAFNAIHSVIDGTLNIDGVGIGRQSDSMSDVSSIYEDIRCIYKIMGIPLMEIYDRINARPQNATEAIFEGNGMKFVMDISPISFALEGFASDLKKYQQNAAQNATRFYEVIQVAREICSPTEDNGIQADARPIAIEYYYADASNKRDGILVNNILNKIAENLMEEVSISPNCNMQFMNRYAHVKRTFAMQAWFEIFHKGYYTLPKNLGSKRVEVDQETIQIIHAKTKLGIDSIAAITKATIYQGYNSNTNNANCTQFILFCVNAYVGDTYVIPKAPGATIHEAPLYALWFRWNEQQYVRLRETGAIVGNHVPWEIRYLQDMAIRPYADEFKCMSHPLSLTAYVKRAQEEMNSFPSNWQFRRATHPVEYLYPGLYLDLDGNEIEEKDPVVLTVPRDGVPKVEVLTGRELDKDTYAKNRLNVTYAEQHDTYIRKFIGFDIEAMMSGKDVIDMLPQFEFNDIVVMGENIVFANSGKSISYTRLTEEMTPFFKHVSGRFYLLRDMEGALWEVRL